MTVLASTQRLGDLCDVVAGGTPPRTNLDYFGGDVPWVKIGDMLQGHIHTTEECLTEEGLAACRAKVLPPGTLLVSIFATIGRTAVLDIPAATNQAIVGVMPRDRKVLDPTFLRYFLDLHAITLGRQSRGVAQNNINASMLKDVPVPIPFPDDPRRSLAEQKRIAAILDKADAIRCRRQEAARLADTLIPSVFYEMFGRTNAELRRWPMSPLSAFIVDGPQNGLYRPSTEYGSGTRIVRIDSFYQGELCHLDELKRVRLEDDTIQKWLLRRDDLLINRVNSTEFLGKSAIVPEHDEPMVFESNMMRFRVDADQLVPRFLIAMLQTRLIKGQILKKERPAVNQSSINQDDVKGLMIPMPPRELQRDFAKRVPAMQRQRDAQPPRAETADTLFNSLVQRAFRGEL